MAGKGLGAGLGAIFGDAALEEENKEGRQVSISKVEPRKDQPRSFFDEEALQELAESIREHGIIQPLTVRTMGDGFYQIIAGERRWRAARLAGLSEVPVRVIDVDDKKAMELAMVENLQREDLNPVEEAKGYKVLIGEYGLTQESVAQRVGKSRPVVTNAIRLLSLPEEVLQNLEDGTLSMSHARALLELKSNEDVLKVAKLIVEKGLTVRQAVSLIKGGAKPIKEEKEGEINYYDEAGKDLSKKLGRKVSVVSGKKKGTIQIEYYDAEDFNSVFEALCDLKIAHGGDRK